MDSKQKRSRVAIEPNEWLGVAKVCPYCQSSAYKFKYLNNRKHDQPRYSCLDCKKFYGLHAQKGARRPHPEGYTKRKARSDVLQAWCPTSGYGFEHLLPNDEPNDRPTTSSECLECGSNCHAILPNQHTQQLLGDDHVTQHEKIQNLVNYSRAFDRMVASNISTLIEEPGNIPLDTVEDECRNVGLEKENFKNVFNYTCMQFRHFLEEPKRSPTIHENLSDPIEDIVSDFMEHTQQREHMEDGTTEAEAHSTFDISDDIFKDLESIVDFPDIIMD